MPCGCFGKKNKAKDASPELVYTPGEKVVKSAEGYGGVRPLPTDTSSAPLQSSPGSKAMNDDDPGRVNKRRDVVASYYEDQCELVGYKNTGSRPSSTYVDGRTPSQEEVTTPTASQASTIDGRLSSGRTGALCRAELAEKRREFFRELAINGLTPQSGYYRDTLPANSTLPLSNRGERFGLTRPLRPVSHPSHGSVGSASPVASAEIPGPHLLRHIEVPRERPQMDSLESDMFAQELSSAAHFMSNRWQMSDEEKEAEIQHRREKKLKAYEYTEEERKLLEYIRQKGEPEDEVLEEFVNTECRKVESSTSISSELMPDTSKDSALRLSLDSSTTQDSLFTLSPPSHQSPTTETSEKDDESHSSAGPQLKPELPPPAVHLILSQPSPHPPQQEAGAVLMDTMMSDRGAERVYSEANPFVVGAEEEVIFSVYTNGDARGNPKASLPSTEGTAVDCGEEPEQHVKYKDDTDMPSLEFVHAHDSHHFLSDLPVFDVHHLMEEVDELVQGPAEALQHNRSGVETGLKETNHASCDPGKAVTKEIDGSHAELQMMLPNDEAHGEWEEY